MILKGGRYHVCVYHRCSLPGQTRRYAKSTSRRRPRVVVSSLFEQVESFSRFVLKETERLINPISYTTRIAESRTRIYTYFTPLAFVPSYPSLLQVSSFRRYTPGYVYRVLVERLCLFLSRRTVADTNLAAKAYSPLDFLRCTLRKCKTCGIFRLLCRVRKASGRL
jgi:hypothetical protein